MKILLLFLLIIIVIFFIGKNLIHLAKRNLFKDQAAWSGKDIKIKYRNALELSKAEKSNNYLKMIAKESKSYLDDQLKKDEE
tara:strand:+ start:184 stop:429 length:246 start_codon:yes stop_codon:yes gene_type:complete